MKKLTDDLKATASLCLERKKNAREAQRALSLRPKDLPWKEVQKLINGVSTWRSLAGEASTNMTILCVLRASLRGKKHLSENSSLNEFVEKWIATTTPKYILVEAPAHEVKQAG